MIWNSFEGGWFLECVLRTIVIVNIDICFVAERLRKLEASVVDIAVEARLDKLAVAVCTEKQMITDIRITRLYQLTPFLTVHYAELNSDSM